MERYNDVKLHKSINVANGTQVYFHEIFMMRAKNLTHSSQASQTNAARLMIIPFFHETENDSKLFVEKLVAYYTRL